MNSVGYNYDGRNTTIGPTHGVQEVVRTASHYVVRDTASDDKVCFSVADSALLLLDCFAEYSQDVLTGTSGPSQRIHTVPLSSAGPLFVEEGPILASKTLPSLDDTAIAVAYLKDGNLSMVTVLTCILQKFDILRFASYRICSRSICGPSKSNNRGRRFPPPHCSSRSAPSSASHSFGASRSSDGTMPRPRHTMTIVT